MFRRLRGRAAPDALPSRTRSNKRYANVALVVLAAVGGCGCEDTLRDAAEVEKKVNGAVITGPAAGVAGATIQFDVTGSRLDGGPCPKNVIVWAGNTPKTLSPLQTDPGAGCAVTNGKVELQLPKPPAGQSNLPVKVHVEGLEGKEYYESWDEYSIRVDEAAPFIPAPPQQFTSAPPSGGGDDHGDGGHDPGHQPVGEEPQADFIINPMAPVEGTDLELDARLSSDPDGHIVAYRWDLDDDGEFDDNGGPVTEPEELTPAGSAGMRRIGLEVTDDDGNTSVMIAEFPVEPTGTVRAERPTVASGTTPPATGDTVWFYLPQNVAGADQVQFDADNDGTFEEQLAYDPSTTQWFDASFSTAGINRVNFLYVDFDTGKSSNWSTLVEVASTRRSVVAFAAKKRSKALKTTASLSVTPKILEIGDLAFEDGRLTTQDALVSGTMKGSIPLKARKRAPKALKGLFRSRFVGEFSGERVPLSPEAFAVAGTGTIVARPARGRKNVVCLSIKSDGGASPDGSTWKVIGAAGKAKRFRGSGTFAPLFVGAPAPQVPNTLTVKRGAPKGLTPTCKALAKKLPGAKKGKKRRRK